MQTSELSVGKQGRIVIPASMRRQLAIETGTHLLAWVEDGRLIMESKQQLWQSIHSACKDICQKVSLSNELIDERRLAACLASGTRLSIPIITADRIWNELKLEIEIEFIR